MVVVEYEIGPYGQAIDQPDEPVSRCFWWLSVILLGGWSISRPSSARCSAAAPARGVHRRGPALVGEYRDQPALVNAAGPRTLIM